MCAIQAQVRTGVKRRAPFDFSHFAGTFTPVRTGDATTGELLSEEMRIRRLSGRGLARLLAGEGASDQQVENWRSKIIRYRNHGAEPEEETAAAMESALGKKAGYFPRVDRGQDSSGLARRVEVLEREMAALRRGEPPSTGQSQSQGI